MRIGKKIKTEVSNRMTWRPLQTDILKQLCVSQELLNEQCLAMFHQAEQICWKRENQCKSPEVKKEFGILKELKRS